MDSVHDLTSLTPWVLQPLAPLVLVMAQELDMPCHPGGGDLHSGGIRMSPCLRPSSFRSYHRGDGIRSAYGDGDGDGHGRD